MKQVISLNGDWKFTPVLDQRPQNNHSLIEGETPAYAYPELIRRDWETVTVPGVWQRYGERYSIYEGVCWYSKEFDISSLSQDTKALLRFGGVIYRADVYVNGKYAGFHESGYTEFTMDVSEFVTEGKNHIAVSVDNRPLLIKWPDDWGYFNYGGIHRSVNLELYSADYLDNLEITPDYDVSENSTVLTIKGNKTGDGNISVTLDGQDYLFDSSDIVINAPLSPWTPENPVLYDLKISFNGNTYFEDKIGFRNVKTDGEDFLLNGKKYRLNGCCYVYDSPKYGLYMAKDQLSFDLNLLKDGGVNAIRTHYPMDEAFYALCDKMGFLVWIEPNIYCTKPSEDEKNTVFSRPEWVENAKQMIGEMIVNSRRFASVAIYGIGNECNVSHSEAMPFFKSLATLSKKLDPTRPTGYAALYDWVGTMSDIVDILGINSYFGWYDKISDIYTHTPKAEKDGKVEVEDCNLDGFHSLMETVKAKLTRKIPLLLTEFGGDSIPGYYSSACDLWSEDYHAKVISEMINASYKHKEINGTFIFTFNDYLDPSKPKNGFWKEHNLKGMVSYDRNIKLPYYAMKKAYKSN